ncbi:MAG: radical SAM protein, partial [Actinomycetia bacterium]|nr:radical SAM protein [Actinomycetes bacterium]
MKYTIYLTRKCNLMCDYCYVGKDESTLSVETARRIVDFIFSNTPPDEMIGIIFFGGEPFLKFELMKQITEMIEDHPQFDHRVRFIVGSNGTIFNDRIAEFLLEHGFNFLISCDGPPEFQDQFRRYRGGRSSASKVENTIKKALTVFPDLQVCSVYHPRTFRRLPVVFDYLTDLGVQTMSFSADMSASWTMDEASILPDIFKEIGRKHVNLWRKHEPRRINIIDEKIRVILKGKYSPGNRKRCRAGEADFAFAPSGNTFPCECLVGDDDLSSPHFLGNINDGPIAKMSCPATLAKHEPGPCDKCDYKHLCMNW